MLTPEGTGSSSDSVAVQSAYPNSSSEDDSMKDPDPLQEAIIARIRWFYDNGMPLFTKSQIADVGRQKYNFEKGHIQGDLLFIEGINGDRVGVSIYGENNNYDESIWETATPRIIYRSIQEMTEWYGEGRAFDARTAFLPLGIRWEHLEDPGSSSGYESEEVFRPRPLPPEATPKNIAKIERKFNQKKRTWEATRLYRTMQQNITNNPEFAAVRKVIRIGLGALEHGKHSDDTQDTIDSSFAQYALLLTVRELIARQARTESILCYAQDPALSPVDVAALTAVGITVLDDPGALLEIDERSFVISIAPEIPVKQIVTDIARPIGMIWDVDDDPGTPWTFDPPSAKSDEMLNDEYFVLTFGYYGPFSGATMYLRKSKSDSDEELEWDVRRCHIDEDIE
ncbi:hypothetical protein F5Y12DRAFT_717368 [Xylaria sp. FL1777]|nr:hypothetical protein F5Y12DRAFT_717368 [Xylaria sp. FL1777]